MGAQTKMLKEQYLFSRLDLTMIKFLWEEISKLGPLLKTILQQQCFKLSDLTYQWTYVIEFPNNYLIKYMSFNDVKDDPFTCLEHADPVGFNYVIFQFIDFKSAGNENKPIY